MFWRKEINEFIPEKIEMKECWRVIVSYDDENTRMWLQYDDQESAISAYKLALDQWTTEGAHVRFGIPKDGDAFAIAGYRIKSIQLKRKLV